MGRLVFLFLLGDCCDFVLERHREPFGFVVVVVVVVVVSVAIDDAPLSLTSFWSPVSQSSSNTLPILIAIESLSVDTRLP